MLPAAEMHKPPTPDHKKLVLAMRDQEIIVLQLGGEVIELRRHAQESNKLVIFATPKTQVSRRPMRLIGG